MKNLKVFTDNIEGKALSQVHELMSQPAFADAKVRIMPDVHAGCGCVIGFTADLGEKIIPNVVGVDIGCGMLTCRLGKIDIDMERLDAAIRNSVPSGFSVHQYEGKDDLELENLVCFPMLRGVDRIKRSIGTLGGGNHFIEIDADGDGNKYLVIHTGSRNLGKQVADIYQKIAIGLLDNKAEKFAVVEQLKAENRQSEIPDALSKISQRDKMPKHLAFLEGKAAAEYLHDMKFCQKFAEKNRAAIAIAIAKEMDFNISNSFETVHNYIGEDNIVRKGAIAAYKGQEVLIPINMRDGCILGRGLGNEDWNCSAPHGAGRIMSRTQAKAELNLEDFQSDMGQVFSTSVLLSTLDESPRAYKPMQEILDNIAETVEVVNIIKPIYNFKAN